MQDFINFITNLKPEMFAMAIACWLLVVFEKTLKHLSYRIDKLTQSIILLIDNVKDSQNNIERQKALQECIDSYLKKEEEGKEIDK